MIRTITITPVLNGFLCQVGCQTIVFKSVGGLVKVLRAYLTNPEETEKLFLGTAINSQHMGFAGVATNGLANDCAPYIGEPQAVDNASTLCNQRERQHPQAASGYRPTSISTR